MYMVENDLVSPLPPPATSCAGLFYSQLRVQKVETGGCAPRACGKLGITPLQVFKVFHKVKYTLREGAGAWLSGCCLLGEMQKERRRKRKRRQK